MIARILDAHVGSHGLGEVIVGDAGFVLARTPDTVRGPDVAFVAGTRVALQRDRSKAFEGAPDLAVEVLSPSSTPSET
ncbi:MAG TPA: Uma2 family endonuclease, partial [Candidatus Polarisedimenticolaceae bacterium]|nr:Uma2 family endonuclease [Candidatus Polarisedimenticolaceae bacterium]